MAMSKSSGSVPAGAHGYGAVKGAKAVPAMRGANLGRGKARTPGTAPADHVVAPPIAARQVTNKTAGKRLT
jgi:hypothetical protein